ncbi:MarR family winged helix-turn-helix transcriptional regulator [Pinibacter soli]|uniref:MarR family winged helix-turn-helix transcriptional regulator n=1 Tax=Pinibacter soli TaxID=3044211 RepID=A0ABT6RI43_9BACT|nr:MarR family winged helix-turn-helix transcriptional regulator [Pinibacter soli]MDI3322198.1 MarR family winged helix-turn-helix transcriptional regulator [Pinibacter soli]
MNIIDELGELAIGARMRRLYDVFSRDVMKIYNDHNLDFEAKYFTLFYLVSKRNGIGIMDAAEELSLTHPAIIHLAKDLERKGYIESVKSPLDSRKRLLMLSRKGKAALPAFKEVWNKIDKLNKKLMRAQNNNLLKALEEIENLLDEKSYYKRYQNL